MGMADFGWMCDLDSTSVERVVYQFPGPPVVRAPVLRQDHRLPPGRHIDVAAKLQPQRVYDDPDIALAAQHGRARSDSRATVHGVDVPGSVDVTDLPFISDAGAAIEAQAQVLTWSAEVPLRKATGENEHLVGDRFRIRASESI